MAYANELELTLRQIVNDSQLVHNGVHGFMVDEDIKKLEDALYYAENITILLNRVINAQNAIIKSREKVNA